MEDFEFDNTMNIFSILNLGSDSVDEEEIDKDIEELINEFEFFFLRN